MGRWQTLLVVMAEWRRLLVIFDNPNTNSCYPPPKQKRGLSSIACCEFVDFFQGVVGLEVVM